MKLSARQRLLVTLLGALHGEISKTDFQKLLFLYTREAETEPSFEFVPYRLGCFSFGSYLEKRRLVELGLLEDDEAWKLSEIGKEVSRERDLDEGKESRLRVLDWETGQLYWNCLRNAEGDEGIALAKVRQKYFDTFTNTDLHFFLGTTLNYHSWATNPWVIIGAFPAPHVLQPSLF